MGKWVGGGWSWFPGAGNHWTYSPYKEGSDNPNLPPPSVVHLSLRGAAYRCNQDGHIYRTWNVPAPRGTAIQTIVDWREKLDVTGGDPSSIEVSKGQ